MWRNTVKSLKKKIPVVVAAVAAVALTLVGCSSAGSTPDPNAKVELKVWTFGGMGLDEMFAKYQKDNPNVTLKVTNAGGSDEQAQSLTTALAGGQGPDVAAIEVSYMSQFKAQAKNFVDLRTLGADDIESKYLDWRWAQGVADDGAVVGIPTDVGGLSMAYRTDLFAAAGLPTDRDAVSALWPTWDDFIKVGAQYRAATGKGMIDNVGAAVYNAAVRQGEEMYYSEDGTKTYETNPVVKKAFDYSLKAVESGISSKTPSWSEAWNAGMNNGDFAVLAAPSWMMTYISQQAPKTSGKWDIAAVPGNSGNFGGSQLTIPAKSKHPKEAFKFITWLMSPETQLEVFKLHGNFPSTPELYTTPSIQDFTSPFFNNAPVGPIFAKSVQAIKPFNEGPQQRLIDTGIINAVGQVENGERPADGAWEEALKNVKTALG
jgi:cellobiose transport system substrate-binding protein